MADEVVPGIRQISHRIVNAYLIEAADGLALVDTGTSGRAHATLAAIRDAGRQPANLHDIVLTHCHPDHAGSLAALAAATGARVYVHPLDAGVVRDGGVPPRGVPNGRLAWMAVSLIPARRLAAAPVHHELVDGAELPIAGGLRVIATPGHTRGHVSFLWPFRGGVLFAGDAAANLFGRLGHSIVAEDPAAADASLRRLATLEFDVAVFGHGQVLRGKANAAFRRFVDRYPKG